eukprot:CAMPEP_0116990316 /NCGR_PEP_ID=MMETSP0467-20121206/65402_1 /TAXON_ID=283647 /ORGANISM="Mesodinium pulex, Strain SPMC105" /LENGTH=133 /DNA_ID=CAMNT_0004687049 /DNA_START=403 /DNA_END=804 /DNA_ORIENTATION=-
MVAEYALVAIREGAVRDVVLDHKGLLVVLGDAVAVEDLLLLGDAVGVHRHEFVFIALVLAQDPEWQVEQVQHLDQPDVVLELLLVEQHRRAAGGLQRAEPLGLVPLHHLGCGHLQSPLVFLELLPFVPLEVFE